MPIPATPILVAPSPTPFAADDSVDFAAIEHNVGRWLQTPLSGFVLNSENGEESFLSEDEKLEIIRTVDQARGGERLIIAGIDNPSVRETLRLGEAYVKAGAELLRVRIPRLTREVKAYFEAVAQHAPAPIVVIHQPAPGTFLTGGVSLAVSAELIAEMISLENVFGYIISADLRLEARVRRLVPDRAQFWASNGTLTMAAAAQGCDGGCMMLGNVFPAECLDIIRLCDEGNLAAAQAIHNRIVEADWQLLSRGAAGLKAGLNLMGYRCGGPRQPSAACSEEAVEDIRAALVAAGCAVME